MVKINFNLNGEENKKNFILNYDFKPISYQVVLKGREKRSVSGHLLTSRYYCIEFNRKGDLNKNTFYCGYSIAERLLELTGKPKLELFNPLVGILDENEGRNNNLDVAHLNNATRKEWDQSAKQLHNAINILIFYWDIQVNKILAEILNKIDRNPSTSPSKTNVKAVNTIISKINKGKTIQDLINELRLDGHNIKEFDFSLLNEIMRKNYENEKLFFG